jgi:predicted RNA-binding protein with PIN domain
VIDKEDNLARAKQLLEDMVKYCELTQQECHYVWDALEILDKVDYSFTKGKSGE